MVGVPPVQEAKVSPSSALEKLAGRPREHACLVAGCRCKVNHHFDAHRSCTWQCGRCKHQHVHQVEKVTRYYATCHNGILPAEMR
jgi:hypothetical protein